MDKNSYNDFIVLDDGLVDISSGRAQTTGSNKNGNSPNPDKKKKIILISAIAATVVIALGVTGFCLFQSGVFGNSNSDSEFVFEDDTVVSGISIAGKTLEEAKELLTLKEESFIKPVSISVYADGEITTLTQADFEYTYDIDEVLNEIKNDTIDHTNEDKEYSVTATVTVDSVEKNAEKIETATNREAKNAYVSKFTPYAKNRFEYAEAEKGKELNTTDLSDQLKAAISQGVSETRIVAEVETVEAKIQIDDLKKNIEKLASYQTVSTNSANGTENMKISLAACNGSVIEPGATWSFNECTGDSNLESNGYKAAGVIVNGELTSGIGGGICQSSSTIYNAAIRANMDIEERYCHMWASSYVPTGLDATIDYPRLDLKLSNPTEYQMFMECKVVDNTLYVSIWGVKDSSYDEIKTENELTDKGSSRYTVKAWRVYYKDGKEVDREELGSSSYDTDHGYVFISAENDTNDKNTNVDNVTEPAEETTTKPTQKPTEKPATQPTTKATEKPTTKPTTEPTEKPTTKPTESTEPETPVETEPAED